MSPTLQFLPDSTALDQTRLSQADMAWLQAAPRNEGVPGSSPAAGFESPCCIEDLREQPCGPGSHADSSFAQETLREVQKLLGPRHGWFPLPVGSGQTLMAYLWH